ncbi:MAG: hypothetical protein LUE64_05160 [Candidatus Gastranaerophilales bacterium]|nr:hypothetical protein [Candidatus Gastranaerophilales bacterium]
MIPVSLFWGDEDYLIEKDINEIKNNVLCGNFSDLNYRIFDNPEFCDLIFILRAQPLIFGECVYIIKADKYFLESGKKIKLEDKETDELIEALSNVSDKIHIILVCQIPRDEKKKPDQRKKIYKAVQKYGKVKEFQAFKPYEDYKVLPIARQMLKELELNAGDNVIKEIISRTGTSLRDVFNAFERLKLFIYPQKNIDKKNVENIYPVSRNVFSLIDLVLENKSDLFFSEISNMLFYSHILEILAFLQSGFTRILNTKIYSNLPFSEIAKKTGQNEYAVKISLNKIKNININRLVKLKLNLTKAEYEIKIGEKEPLAAIMEAVLT